MTKTAANLTTTRARLVAAFEAGRIEQDSFDSLSLYINNIALAIDGLSPKDSRMVCATRLGDVAAILDRAELASR